MSSYKFNITISGTEKEATEKAKGIAVIAAHLDAKTITALAKIVQTEPTKVAMAKRFLGL